MAVTFTVIALVSSMDAFDRHERASKLSKMGISAFLPVVGELIDGIKETNYKAFPRGGKTTGVSSRQSETCDTATQPTCKAPCDTVKCGEVTVWDDFLGTCEAGPEMDENGNLVTTKFCSKSCHYDMFVVCYVSYYISF